jgi:hypothetical protein
MESSVKCALDGNERRIISGNAQSAVVFSLMVEICKSFTRHYFVSLVDCLVI